MDRESLRTLVDGGFTLGEIAASFGVHRNTAAQWLREHGLRTQRQQRRDKPGDRAEFDCPRHGHTMFARKAEGGWRCLRCRSEAVTRRRRRVKERLVAEAGGACVLCGYSRCLAALEFHHLEPSRKRFSVAARGVTRSLAEARLEARKCVLLCSNCHAEVEAGVATLQAKHATADHWRESIPG
jgi:hypothetical protein